MARSRVEVRKGWFGSDTDVLVAPDVPGTELVRSTRFLACTVESW